MNHSRSFFDVYAITTLLVSSPQRTIYRSVEPDSNRDIVVKLLTSNVTSSDPILHDRFLRDIGALQLLSLQAFPEILNFGVAADNSAFMVMEWIDGDNISSLAEVQPDRIIPLLAQITESLETLAMGGVYHDNLSPDNILVQTLPDDEVAKILGFGTTAFFSEIAAGTVPGRSTEVERFIAPERLGASENVSEAGVLSDLYSLALVTVDILGGDISDLGSDDPEVRFPEDIRGALSNAEVLEDALSGALAMAPAKRQTTYAILRNALEWDYDYMEGVDLISDPDRISETLVELPPQERSEGSTPPSEEDGDPGEEITTVLKSPGLNGPIDEDLIQTDPGGFNPNKTDPVFIPPLPSPPELPKEQTPEIEAVPQIQEGGRPRLNFDRRLLLWVPIGLAIMVILGIGTVKLWRLALRPQAKSQPTAVVQPTAVPRVRAPEIPTEAQVHPGLAQADVLLLEDDVEGARAILSAITPEEIELFSTEEVESFNAMNSALEGSRFDAAVSDLKGGLDHGSIRMLKRGVAGVQRANPEDLADRPDIPPMLKKGQNALRIHALMWKAHESQDHRLVLEQCSAMIEVLPMYSTPFQFREEAALALENVSEQAFEAGYYDQARGRLSPITTYWPDREGLSQRLSTIENTKQELEDQRTHIAEALAISQAGDPEEGLAILEGITPVAMLQRHYSEAVTLLEKHRAELDAQPPEVVFKLKPQFEFKKKKTVTIQLIVTDDHQVTGVSAYLKAAGANGYSKINLNPDPSTGSCTLDIGPETHNNNDFLLYVEAVDGSGHTGRLASPQAPLEFKRKKGLKALFGK